MESSEKPLRAKITVKGHVTGVGFRYFVFRNAVVLGLKGFTRNLPSGEVYTVVEGPAIDVLTLFNKMKQGPSMSRVTNVHITYEEITNEFDSFEIVR